MNIYYFANQIYQFSNILPLYRKLGGTFIVRKRKKYIQFKYYLRNGSAFPDDKTFLNTPHIQIMDVKNLYDLDGVIISTSNTRINCDRNKCKTIFIGHGTGDKKYGGNPLILESFDYHFISGAKHLAKIRDVEVDIPEERLIKIGNLRFDEYVNKLINREKYLDSLGIVDRKRKNILYAPTWRWGNGTLKRYGKKFCRELTKEYNLIIRPHHHERKLIPKMKLWARFNGLKHVYFSNPARLLKQDTMYDFAISDLMISDTSSILYEYLITSNPIIIAKSDYNQLHTMPGSLDVHQVASIYDGSPNTNILDLVNEALSNPRQREKYTELLDNCFYFNDGNSLDRSVEFILSQI